MSAPATLYRPRNPQSCDYYRCVEYDLETFVRVYEEVSQGDTASGGPISRRS